MFPHEIHLERESQIPFGTTKLDFFQTQADIQRMLAHFGAQRILINKDGDKHEIMFELHGKAYMLRVPRVYVKKGKGRARKEEYMPHIGIRVIYHYLKAVLPYIEGKMVLGEQALLAARLVINKDGEMVPLSAHVDEVIERGGYYGSLPQFSSTKVGEK